MKAEGDKGGLLGERNGEDRRKDGSINMVQGHGTLETVFVKQYCAHQLDTNQKLKLKPCLLDAVDALDAGAHACLTTP